MYHVHSQAKSTACAHEDKLLNITAEPEICWSQPVVLGDRPGASCFQKSIKLKEAGVIVLSLFSPKGLMKKIVTTGCEVAEKNFRNRVKVSRKNVSDCLMRFPQRNNKQSLGVNFLSFGILYQSDSK